MRIINKEVIGTALPDLANQYFKSLCPKNKDGKYNGTYPAGKIRLLAEKRANFKYSKIFRFLNNRVEDLFTGDPNKLMSLRQDLIDELTLTNDQGKLTEPDCKKLLSRVFVTPYETFRDGGRKVVYEWFEKLNLQTCPYCNRNLTSKSKSKDGTTTDLYFDIDHYFPKGQYPYFALSFYNLIPSCTICNQRIKRTNKLDIKKHLHPYLDDFDDLVKFDVPVDKLDVFFDEHVEIDLQLVGRQNRLQTDIDRAINTYKFFNLENLYKTHLDYVRELLQKEIVYSPEYVSQLYQDYSGDNKIFDSEDDLKKMLVGNYVLPEHIHKRPLAKLTKDLMEDFNIRS
jgi:uncharacterized protein (TIGR02646 family)